VDSGHNLVVNFDEAGLTTSSINYTLSASVSYGCSNKPGTHTTRSLGTISTTASRSVSGGQLNSSITLTAPSAASCPNGQFLTITYSSVVLTDTINSITVHPANASRTF
jgi:hypothetical protein